MGNFAQTALQASDGFLITKSDTLDIVSDPNNKQGYKFCYVHVQGASGLVQVTPVDGQGGPYSIATNLIATLPGSGYNSGVFTGVTLNYLNGKVGTNVVANVTVTAGAVTAITYVSGGVGADNTTNYFYSAGQSGKLGGGTGFVAAVSAFSPTASDFIQVYGVQGTVLGGDMPILVRRVWTTGTAVPVLTALVTKGGSV